MPENWYNKWYWKISYFKHCRPKIKKEVMEKYRYLWDYSYD